MRTVTFKSVLHGVARRMGHDPETDFLSNQAATYTEYINSRVREAYDYHDWSETIIIEQLAADYDATVAYEAGDVVWDPDTEQYYKAVDATPGDDLADTNYWEPTAQFTKGVIGRIIGAYSEDPTSVLRAKRLAWELGNGAVRVKNSAETWLEYQEREPVFTSKEWDNTTSYAIDDLVYSATTGECYQALQTNSGTAVTDSAVWDKVDMPYMISEFVKLAAYADALREEGENTRLAERTDERAANVLADAMDRETVKAGQMPTFRVISRTSV